MIEFFFDCSSPWTYLAFHNIQPLAKELGVDIACFPWTMTHKAQGFTLDDYPNIRRWYAEVRARPQVQAGLAIGKFVKEPFDEEARKNMFGQRAKEMAGKK